MRRVLLLTHCVAIAVIGVASAPRNVHAEPVEVGGMLGPRLFADDSILGDADNAPTSLSDGVLLGVRAARPITPWLVPEVELGLSPATTKDYDIDVLWFEPRAHMRFQIRPDRRVRPFAVLGVGMPVVLSTKRGIYPSGLTGEAYGGGGVGWNPGRGVALRLDARFSVFQGREGEKPVTVEGEVTAGVWFVLGKRGATRARAPGRGVDGPGLGDVADRDGDGYDDAADQCPDRAEDHDGFEDKDGCPDIDNDGDQVLDVADKCATVAEAYNGFEDDDGCPDTVAADVDAIVGTVEGLLYAPGEIEVRSTADEGLDRIIKVLKDHPSVRMLLVGHTDSQEAAKNPPPVAEGEEPPDPAELARDLGRQRATALRNALVKRGGLSKGRFVIESQGMDSPVSDEDSNRGRLRNRRVEVKLFVPKR
jgi:outer membrane protein OmpA-like peptidoglycan-associated protein